ncbi:hypothetical protein SAMN05444714_3262 [Yoonia litorea]|uniref:Uncharacterized protein n=1 Tax=Yoonia litorea TaxID=1123755 RepID=A0A1I6N335_9RHOB|nr:hypothetical protein SAMN05444714_3262 [Yoonia litorea]
MQDCPQFYGGDYKQAEPKANQNRWTTIIQ